ncbi:4-carboxymuconolactone decarboxylase [Telmatospirillum siberiense]|uniref:4-carboxymuconolactone decarboxylase n=2 Tax=Telmatospirillum siberiense TaxID=382514 RepID=A0A2N3PUH8_9PROT|nr:4-carboxymuconolactone decarboxylase [Telmatospirillum siberiense]
MADWNPNTSEVTPEDIRAVAPVLEKYTVNSIVKDLWTRPDLTARDRAIITVSALVARDQSIALRHYFNVALDSGVTPGEISEILTHVAFYAGWPNAFSAVAILKEIFVERGVGADQLPAIEPKLLPIEEALPDENIRVAFGDQQIGPVSLGLRHFTDDLLYHEVWLRPGLAPRDRNLVTVAVLVATGQSTFLPFYLNRAVEKGITRAEVGEILAHLAFYSGWPVVITATAAVKDFFAGRAA